MVQHIWETSEKILKKRSKLGIAEQEPPCNQWQVEGCYLASWGRGILSQINLKSFSAQGCALRRPFKEEINLSFQQRNANKQR